MTAAGLQRRASMKHCRDGGRDGGFQPATLLSLVTAGGFRIPCLPSYPGSPKPGEPEG